MTAISPLLTDLYEFTMMQGYVDHQMEQTASFEFFIRRLPPERNFLMAAGLQQVVEYLEDLSFSEDDISYLRSSGFFHERFLAYLQELRFTGDVQAMAEGTIFFPDEPILRVSAPLPLAQLVETRIINILQFQSMIASKAARIRLIEPKAMLMDFGLRRAHGAEAGLLAARASCLAGFDGTATVEAGRLFGLPIFGTMAHSFIQAHDSEQEAFRHFAASQPDNVVFLIDTYDTIKGAQNVVALAGELAAKNIPIKGVRIDSGDLVAGAFQVRKILDQAGLREVKILLSSSLDEYSLAEITAAGAPVDGYGIGTKMITSADYAFLDCSYKLVEYAGTGRRKRSQGKETWPGRKQVFRQYDDQGLLSKDCLTLDSDRLPGRPLLQPVMAEGQPLAQLPDLESCREHARAELASLPESMRTIEQVPLPELEIAPALLRLTREVDQESAGG
ncbi:nicotinate phosphoribosyltransferase [Desulfogranum mediterraneum]|uniref:nicotinate phosphoribosyltransferase n=1 Tax=Desulfogranum mediterraneum TaxID=160661 RepID=UPI000409BF65|nr:nicotinate phosphoribosyltransferase [Desulfogranum mediterraneum]